MKFNTLVVCQDLLSTEGYHMQNRIESAYEVMEKMVNGLERRKGNYFGDLMRKHLRSCTNGLRLILMLLNLHALMINAGSQSNGVMIACGTNSHWFARWALGCETRMGYVLKQNQAIAIDVLKEMVNEFVERIEKEIEQPERAWMLVCGLVYTIITFHGSLRGNDGLKVHYPTLIKYWEKGNYDQMENRKGAKPPHIIVPLMGRFKGEQGGRCHLLLMANVSNSGIEIRKSLLLLLTMRKRMNIHSVWLFCDKQGDKIKFDDMNDTVLGVIEVIKEKDESNRLEIQEFNIREDFSINRLFRRGSSTNAQMLEIPTDIIELVNRWKKGGTSKRTKSQDVND